MSDLDHYRDHRIVLGHTWLGGLMKSPIWVGEDKPTRPTLALWLESGRGQLSMPVLLEEHDDQIAGAIRALASLAELVGSRPAELVVLNDQLAAFLRDELPDTRVTAVDEIPPLKGILEQMAHDVGGAEVRQPGIMEGKGVTLDHVRAFAKAAKRFAIARPWTVFGGDELVEVVSPNAPGGLKWLTVMGRMGEVIGLSFHRSREEYEELCELGPSGLGKRVQWTVWLQAKHEAPVADVDLWEKHGLDLASDDAFPHLLGVGTTGTIRAADAAFLEFVTGLLNALADSGEEQLNTGQWSVPSRNAGGEVEYRLALPELLEEAEAPPMSFRGGMEKQQFIMHRKIEQSGAQTMDEVNRVVKKLNKSSREPEYEPANPQEQAQFLAYDAMDAEGRQAIVLARKALELWPDCADACYVLGMYAGEIHEAEEWYRRGVDAAKRTLPPELFTEEVGNFWRILETRPYMRCMDGLAMCLAERGQRAEAADTLSEMLRLNPNDNQGVRYHLAPLLMSIDRDEEAARLLKQYVEPTASYAYLSTLLAFRLGGNGPAALAELKKAIELNPYVWAILDSGMRTPSPETYSPGSPEEAVVVLGELEDTLESNPAFRDFILDEGEQFLPPPPKKKTKPSKPKKRGRKQ